MTSPIVSAEPAGSRRAARRCLNAWFRRMLSSEGNTAFRSSQGVDLGLGCVVFRPNGTILSAQGEPLRRTLGHGVFNSWCPHQRCGSRVTNLNRPDGTEYQLQKQTMTQGSPRSRLTLGWMNRTVGAKNRSQVDREIGSFWFPSFVPFTRRKVLRWGPHKV